MFIAFYRHHVRWKKRLTVVIVLKIFREDLQGSSTLRCFQHNFFGLRRFSLIERHFCWRFVICDVTCCLHINLRGLKFVIGRLRKHVFTNCKMHNVCRVSISLRHCNFGRMVLSGLRLFYKTRRILSVFVVAWLNSQALQLRFHYRALGLVRLSNKWLALGWLSQKCFL